MPDALTPGALIRQAREHAGLTQQQIADALGVTQTTVSYKEAGSRDLTVTDLLDFARVLRIEPASLLLPLDPPERDEIDAFLDLLAGAMRERSAEASYARMRRLMEAFARECAAGRVTMASGERSGSPEGDRKGAGGSEAPGAAQPRAEVVCLCGPVHATGAMESAYMDLIGAGCIVLVTPDLHGCYEPGTVAEQWIRDHHLSLIDLADRVHVFATPGEDTRREIAYARRAGKKITGELP